MSVMFINEGLIPIEAFTTFGVNSKPNSENPIGHFGTGLKYSVAVVLRLGGRFRLFRGTTEYEFYTKTTDFRGKDFEMIRMRKRSIWANRWSYSKLPFTTELGKEWDAWMAVRELESNTRDENGQSLEYFGVEPQQDSVIQESYDVNQSTIILIECEAIENAYRNLDNIFMSTDKQKIGGYGSVEIYEGPSDYMFFRGLRVLHFQNKPTQFTYNFVGDFDLTEDRTSKYPGYEFGRIVNALSQPENTEILEQVIDADRDKFYEEEFPFDYVFSGAQPNLLALIGSRVSVGRPVPKRMKSLYDEVYADDGDNEVRIAMYESEWKEIIDILGDNSQLGEKIRRQL